MNKNLTYPSQMSASCPRFPLFYICRPTKWRKIYSLGPMRGHKKREIALLYECYNYCQLPF